MHRGRVGNTASDPIFSSKQTHAAPGLHHCAAKQLGTYHPTHNEQTTEVNNGIDPLLKSTAIVAHIV